MCIYIYINIVYTYAHVFVRILHTTMFNNKSIHVPQLDQTCWIIHLKSMLNCWRDVESDTIWRNVHRVQGVLSFFGTRYGFSMLLESAGQMYVCFFSMLLESAGQMYVCFFRLRITYDSKATRCRRPKLWSPCQFECCEWESNCTVSWLHCGNILGRPADMLGLALATKFAFTSLPPGCHSSIWGDVAAFVGVVKWQRQDLLLKAHAL